MNDADIMTRISHLVDEEHQLLQQRDGDGLDDAQHSRMKDLEVGLDQCWDLLRQRRARRDAGLDPDDSRARDPKIVEDYVQ